MISFKNILDENSIHLIQEFLLEEDEGEDIEEPIEPLPKKEKPKIVSKKPTPKTKEPKVTPKVEKPTATPVIKKPEQKEPKSEDQKDKSDDYWKVPLELPPKKVKPKSETPSEDIPEKVVKKAIADKEAAKAAQRNVPHDKEDHELLQAHSLGDEDSTNKLFNKHSKKLIAFARSRLGSLQSKVSAEDIVQQAFEEGFQNLEKLDFNVESFPRFLSKIINARVGDALRYHTQEKRARSKEGGSLNAPIAGTEKEFGSTISGPKEYEDPSSGIAGSEVRAKLGKAISRLNPTQQNIVKLYYLKGYDTIQIAKVLNSNPDTVRQSLHRSLQQLRGHLSEFEDS
jgi:RNA polymerase sigma factor (sigma-70 family)